MTPTTAPPGTPPGRKGKRVPVRCLDSTGARIVLVPLANSALPAVLDEEDFDRWAARRYSTAWTRTIDREGRDYVVAAHAHSEATGGLITVARVIADAGRGKRVKYRDGNRLNLRRNNLYLEDGYAKGREARITSQREEAGTGKNEGEEA